MLNLPLQPRYIFPPLCLIVLSSLLAWLGINNELEFNSQLIEQGQLWRLFTSQFVHANWAHLGLNCAGIALIWLLHGEYTSPSRYSFTFARFQYLAICCTNLDDRYTDTKFYWSYWCGFDGWVAKGGRSFEFAYSSALHPNFDFRNISN